MCKSFKACSTLSMSFCETEMPGKLVLTSVWIILGSFLSTSSSFLRTSAIFFASSPKAWKYVLPGLSLLTTVSFSSPSAILALLATSITLSMAFGLISAGVSCFGAVCACCSGFCSAGFCSWAGFCSTLASAFCSTGLSAVTACFAMRRSSR